MTRVLEKFEYRTLNGEPVIPFWKWVESLSEEERQIFEQAQSRQRQYRQEAIDRGDMVATKQGYIWRDHFAAEKNKPTDPVWLKFWQRWIKECNIDFKINQEHLE